MAEPLPQPRVLIVYYSRFGAVRALADQIAEGARGLPGVEAALIEVADPRVDEPGARARWHDITRRRAAVVNQLALADAVIVGTPAYFGSMASPVKRLFEECAVVGNPPVADRSRPWHGDLFRDKVGAAFTASATPHGGNEQTLHSVLTMLMHLGMLVVTPGQREPILEHEGAPYGATAVSGPDGDRVPTVAEQRAARELGRRVALIAAWLRRGRTVWEGTEAAEPSARAGWGAGSVGTWDAR